MGKHMYPDRLTVPITINTYIFCTFQTHSWYLFSHKTNKKIIVFPVTGLIILGRVGTHFFLNFFSGKKIYNFMLFDRHFTLQNAKDIFSRKPEKNSKFHQ